MSNYSGKTNINIRKITIIPITDEDEGTYGTALDFTGRARSATYTPNVKKAQLYGDGEVQETVIDTSTGTLSLALNYLTDSDRQALFGETTQKGSNVITGNEQPAKCVVIFESLCEKTGKTVNLYKFFNVTFSPNEESVQQIEVDTTATGASTIVDSWFDTAEYIGPTQ